MPATRAELERTLNRVDRKCDKLLRLIVAQHGKENEMLEELRAQVSRNREVDQSAITLIRGIKAKLDEMTQPGIDVEQMKRELKTLADDLGSSSLDLEGAITENTPSDDNSADLSTDD